MLKFILKDIETYDIIERTDGTIKPRILLLPSTGYNPFDESLKKEWQTYHNLCSYYIPSEHYSEKEYELDAFNDFLDMFRIVIKDDVMLDRAVAHFRKKNEHDDRWTLSHLEYMESCDLYLNKDTVIETIKDLDSQWKKVYRKFQIDNL